MLIKKGQRIYSMVYQKCPRCHTGPLFSTTAYSKGFWKMPEKCTHCGMIYNPEPSFYTGAMYVSYALQVAVFTTIYVALRVLFNPSTEVYIFTIIASVILLIPLTLRISRSIYINFFYSYSEKFDSAHQHH